MANCVNKHTLPWHGSANTIDLLCVNRDQFIAIIIVSKDMGCDN